jgi:hypothetical protein
MQSREVALKTTGLMLTCLVDLNCTCRVAADWQINSLHMHRPALESNERRPGE